MAVSNLNSSPSAPASQALANTPRRSGESTAAPVNKMNGDTFVRSRPTSALIDMVLELQRTQGALRARANDLLININNTLAWSKDWQNSGYDFTEPLQAPIKERVSAILRSPAVKPDASAFSHRELEGLSEATLFEYARQLKASAATMDEIETYLTQRSQELDKLCLEAHTHKWYSRGRVLGVRDLLGHLDITLATAKEMLAKLPKT